MEQMVLSATGPVNKPNRVKQQGGFSLIEILVVMVIIGIVLSFVLLSFGDFGKSRQIAVSLEHLESLIKLARQRAIIEAKTFGLDIKKDQYCFYQYLVNQQNATWQPLNGDRLFKCQNFPKQVKTELSLDVEKQHPEILISSDGHITPFKLKLSSKNGEAFYLKARFNGQLTQDK